MVIVGSLNRGGAERQALLCARSLRRVGVEASVFVIGPPATLLEDGVAGDVNVDLVREPGHIPGELRRLLHALERSRPDAVITFLRGATFRFALADLLRRRKSNAPAWLIAERGNIRWDHIKAPATFALRLHCLRHADRIVVNSPSLAANIISFNGELASRTVIIPNVLLPFEVDATSARARVLQLVRQGAGPILGAVGSFQEERNYELLAHAMPRILREYPNAHLVVVGRTHGPECQPSAERFTRLLKRQRIETAVTVAGEIQGARELISGLDVFLLPSKLEGSSNALGEALIAGAAIASTPVADSELVLAGAGVVSEGFTPQAFSHAILGALRHTEDLRCRARLRASTLLRERSVDQSGVRWLAALESALGVADTTGGAAAL